MGSLPFLSHRLGSTEIMSYTTWRCVRFLGHDFSSAAQIDCGTPPPPLDPDRAELACEPHTLRHSLYSKRTWQAWKFPGPGAPTTALFPTPRIRSSPAEPATPLPLSCKWGARTGKSKSILGESSLVLPFVLSQVHLRANITNQPDHQRAWPIRTVAIVPSTQYFVSSWEP